MENTSISVINDGILMKFCTWVVHDKSIAHTEQNSENCSINGILHIMNELFA